MIIELINDFNKTTQQVHEGKCPLDWSIKMLGEARNWVQKEFAVRSILCKWMSCNWMSDKHQIPFDKKSQ